jgi:thymidylate kinase
VIIDISPETSLGRKLKGRDSYERDLEFLSRVRSSYLQLAKNHRWPVLNGERVPDVIGREILKIMDRRLERRHQP